MEVNLIYPFFPAPPCPLQFRFIYHLILLLETFHMGPEDNFCSTKMSKNSVLAKWLNLGRHFWSGALIPQFEFEANENLFSLYCFQSNTLQQIFFECAWQNQQFGISQVFWSKAKVNDCDIVQCRPIGNGNGCHWGLPRGRRIILQTIVSSCLWLVEALRPISVNS